jgi:hypothetical protein
MMSGYKLELNFETNKLSIVSNDKSIAENQPYYIQYVNIPNDHCCVMRVNGIDTSDYEFKLISNEEFNEIVNNYIKQFELMPEEIEVSNKRFQLEKLMVDESNYVFDADLCSFTLYKISVCN